MTGIHMLNYTIILVSQGNHRLQLTCEAETDIGARNYADLWLKNNPEYSMYNYVIESLEAKYLNEDSGLDNII